VTVRRELLLFSELPGLRSIPFLPIASAPTPVERITAFPEFGDRVFVKRDDRASTIYGGNKIRRLELLLAKAADEGARTIVTAGGLASTQVTATILLGRTFGFDVTAVMFDQPKTDFLREALAVDLRAGGRLVYGGSYARTARLFVRERARAMRPFTILPGAATPLCNLAYVDAMLELAQQVERGELPRPTRIVVPQGSGGTVAGIAVGASLLGWDTVVVGVRITDLAVSNRATIALLVDQTARLIARSGGPARRRLTRTRVEVDHRFIGKGYGHATPEAEAGARDVSKVIGAPGEITYSGKAFAGLRRQVAEHPDDVVLFWATLSSVGRTPTRMAPPDGAPTDIAAFF